MTDFLLQHENPKYVRFQHEAYIPELVCCGAAVTSASDVDGSLHIFLLDHYASTAGMSLLLSLALHFYVLHLWNEVTLLCPQWGYCRQATIPSSVQQSLYTLKGNKEGELHAIIMMTAINIHNNNSFVMEIFKLHLWKVQSKRLKNTINKCHKI